MHKLIALSILISGLFLTITAQPFQAYYISPNGNDNAIGTSIETPIASIGKGFELAQPGDTLYLLPGVHAGKNRINDKHGAPDQPITLISYAKDPSDFAVIDAQSEATSENGNEGLLLIGCSWINVENIVFRNCWASVIYIRESNYIGIRSCHFSTGKRVIHAIGHDTHHVLVENCYVKHPEAVWKGWSWESLHHGEVSYYNGALLHPNKSGGGHIMRGNTLINVFNAFRTRPNSIMEDGNIEIYDNNMVNIRDNEFEPESWAWNMHYAYNRHINIHKMYSIDGVRGGNIYIFGNTYTQTTDPWAIEEVSGIFKYSAYDNGALTYPCYAFNNSYYTEAKVLRQGESTNHQLKHFNNAYHFFRGEDYFELTEWQPGFEFDHDCINHDWPSNIYHNEQEQHGLKETEPEFMDGLAGDFRLRSTSPCIDAGKTMTIPELEWTQTFEGDAPDIGAFEGARLADGPAFRFIPSPEGAYYEERPRVSKHKVADNALLLYFSSAIDESTLKKEDIRLYEDGELVNIASIGFPRNAYEMQIDLTQAVESEGLSIVFLNKPKGKNGLSLTYWGSSIAIGKNIVEEVDLSTIESFPTAIDRVPAFEEVSLKVVPNPSSQSLRVEVNFPQLPDMKFVNHIAIYDLKGGELFFLYEPKIEGNTVIFTKETPDLKPGIYIAKIRVGTRILSSRFVYTE